MQTKEIGFGGITILPNHVGTTQNLGYMNQHRNLRNNGLINMKNKHTKTTSMTRMGSSPTGDITYVPKITQNSLKSNLG